MAREAARAGGRRGHRLGRASRRAPRPTSTLPAGARRRHRLSAIFERLDALPARRRDHAPRAAQQSRRAQRTAWKCGDSDRCVSWLPWYHDMGLVGCLLSPVANQVSTDYLKTEDFARRPLAWLDLISRNPGTTLSYSPTFGYDICARRMSSQTKATDRFDLSRWRVAGNGADMIRPDVMQAFVDAFADAGFKASAFLPSYGLAEATLAVSIMPPGEGIVVELVEETAAVGRRRARRTARSATARSSIAASRARHGRSRSARKTARRCPNSAIGKVWCTRPVADDRLFPRPGSDRRLPGRRLARHRRHGLSRRTAISTSSAAPRT